MTKHRKQRARPSPTGTICLRAYIPLETWNALSNIAAQEDRSISKVAGRLIAHALTLAPTQAIDMPPSHEVPEVGDIAPEGGV